jgi:hypothetical protein
MNRLAVGLVIISLFTGVAWGFASSVKDRHTAYIDYLKQVSVAHTVQSCQTLWQIAKHYHPTRDPREVVFFIRQINGLDDPNGPIIYPGQQILVPKDF